MAFEPLGYCDRWYDRIVGRPMNLKGVGIVAIVALVMWIADRLVG